MNGNYYEYNSDIIKTIHIKTEDEAPYNLNKAMDDNNTFILTGGTSNRKPFEQENLIKLFSTDVAILEIEPVYIITYKDKFLNSNETENQINIDDIDFESIN